MFLKSSRYYSQTPVDVTTKDRRHIRAINLRRLPSVTGTPVQVKGNDRLDIIAQQKYSNSTMFWHVADANTALWANDLVKKTDRVKIIEVPDN
jgi:hypothetical protein